MQQFITGTEVNEKELSISLELARYAEKSENNTAEFCLPPHFSSGKNRLTTSRVPSSVAALFRQPAFLL